MTKVWEETWTLRRWFDNDIAAVDTPGAMLVPLTPSVLAAPNAEPENVARARLAACAPEMARMLLGAECEGMDLEGNFYCQWCGVQSGDGAEHVPNCEWLLLMKKAGIR